MPATMIRCPDCGAGHHHRFKCSCRRASRLNGGPRLGGIGFIACWLLVTLAFAGGVFLLLWWAGAEYGRFRGTIAAAGIVMFTNLFAYGILVESWLEGESDWDPFNHMLGNIAGGVAETIHDWAALRSLHRMERPWMKAGLTGTSLGVMLGMATALSARTPATGDLLNATMPALTLPLAGGGEFQTSDLGGRVTAIFVRDRGGSSAARIDDAWGRAAIDGPVPDRMLIVLDQYGKPGPYSEGRWFKVKDPIAVGRKWLRESLGDFTGNALVLLVDGDLVIRHLVDVRDQPPVSDEEADVIVQELLLRWMESNSN